MTDKRERLSLLRALMRQFPDLVQRPGIVSSRMVIPKPVHHVEFEIIIDRTSSRNHFNVILCFWILYDAAVRLQSQVNYNLFHTVSRPGAEKLWDLGDPNIEADLIEVVWRDVLSRYRRMHDISDVEAFLRTGRSDDECHWHHPNVRALLALAKGDFSDAKATLDKFPWVPTWRDLDEQGDGLGARIHEQGDGLGREDRMLLARLFHTWEEANVGERGLRAHWQSTPFPFEQA